MWKEFYSGPAEERRKSSRADSHAVFFVSIGVITIYLRAVFGASGGRPARAQRVVSCLWKRRYIVYFFLYDEKEFTLESVPFHREITSEFCKAKSKSHLLYTEKKD